MKLKSILITAAKTCLIVMIALGICASGFGLWIETQYLQMPTQPSGDRTLELYTGHKHKVFVTKQEHDNYTKYSVFDQYGTGIAAPAIFLLVLLILNQRKAERGTSSRF